jgi:NAD(P)-dependent dehydrogenase (short-subunit alcohol dehydrogenase family)
MPTAVITGASAGLGQALATALARRGWNLVLDARRPDRLLRLADELSRFCQLHAVTGDVSDGEHRDRLAEAIAAFGSLDLLVNNASTLGPTPLPPLTDLAPGDLSEILQVNLVAPLALVQLALPALTAAGGVVVNVSSDAAVAHYPGWGGYGCAKAALDHLSATLAVENPQLRWYSFDPGDMRTEMHQAAFAGEDISDRPAPEAVLPSLLRLIDTRLPSGRYTSSGPELAATDANAAEAAAAGPALAQLAEGATR